MTLEERREKQPLTELGEGESKPAYQDNVEFTIGVEGKTYTGANLSNCISIKTQVRDMNVDLAEITPLRVYLSSSATGASAPVAAETSATVRVGTEVQSITANAHLRCLTDANGVLTIDIVDTGTPTQYLVVEYAGRIFVSGAMTWA